jgi:hypothetical protein
VTAAASDGGESSVCAESRKCPCCQLRCEALS